MLTSEKDDALAADLKEHLLCGEKLVRFYEIGKKTKTTMVEALVKAKPPKSSFKDSYPTLLFEDDLEAQPTNPILVAVEELEDGVAAVFASTHSILLREPLVREELPKKQSKHSLSTMR